MIQIHFLIFIIVFISFCEFCEISAETKKEKLFQLIYAFR